MRTLACILSVMVVLCCGTSAGAQARKAGLERPRPARPQIRLVDARGLAVEAPAIGANLTVAASGLLPGRQYDIYVWDHAGLYVSMLRLTSDSTGSLPPAVLWYQSGVVGCGKGVEPHLKLPYRFRTFEEAEAKLAGAPFTLEMRDREQVLARRPVTLSANKRPIVYPSDANGCLLNSSDGSEDIYVAGRNFVPGTIAEIYLVPHQATGKRAIGSRTSSARATASTADRIADELRGALVAARRGPGRRL